MKTAMILAAGRGERLSELTRTTPKALCQIHGKPSIEHHVCNLSKAGFDRIVINHAYLGGQIREYLGDGSRYGLDIVYSPEPPGALETGGGILNALPLLGSQPFITVNADIYTDYDFNLIDLQGLQCIHVILINKNPALHHYGDFGLHGELVTNSDKNYTLMGVNCFHPRVFKHTQLGRFSITPLIRQAADLQKVTGSLYQGVWFDIGSVQRLHAARGGI